MVTPSHSFWLWIKQVADSYIMHLEQLYKVEAVLKTLNYRMPGMIIKYEAIQIWLSNSKSSPPLTVSVF